MTGKSGTGLMWTRRGTLAGIAGLGVVGVLPAAANQGAGEAEGGIVYDSKNMLPGDYTWHPERSPTGAVAVVVSLPEQLCHVYRNGVRIGVSTTSSGKPGHETPTGVFTVLQKDKHHHSSIYNNASMPDTMRLTWGGVALHAGGLPGYPSSHGCVHLPLEFSDKLFEITHLGTPVIVAGAASDPWELIHPGVLLGEGAEGELEAAVAELSARKHPSDWTAEEVEPVTTLLVTGADRRAVLIENGREIAEAPLTIVGSESLGEHVFLLRHPAPDDPHLVWHGITHHPDPASPLEPEGTILDRLRTPEDFTAELRQRMHPGMTLIVSDLRATPDRRSDEDFVIMTGTSLTSPRPKVRGDEVAPISPTDDRG